MARTPVKPEKGLEDWFLAHYASSRLGRFEVRPPDVDSFINFLWPVALEYYSPLNPVFLSECMGLEQMNSHSVWLSRDGAIPLLWFFKSNPVPDKFKSHLLVHESLAHLIPTAWHKSVGTYSLTTLKKSPEPVPRRLFLIGIAMDTYCSIPHLIKQLELARAAYSAKEFSKMQILAFLPTRFDGFGNEHRHEFCAEFMFTIAKHLGTNIRPLNWRMLESMATFKGCEVLDLNEGYLCQDNYLTHYALAREATLFGSKERTQSAAPKRIVQLSNFHGMHVSETLSTKYRLATKLDRLNASSRYLSSTELLMHTEANRRFPWPMWFNEWGKTACKS